ncbi:MAG: helix-turn-helix transcriptional regulator [Chloroherpetonaceae bacterium]
MQLSIGEFVKIARERMGLSQSQIAEYLEVDTSYIDKCERGKCAFTAGMIEKLADLFGCKYEDLESGIDIYPNKNLLEIQDLNAIVSINKIISNIQEMKYLLEKG